MVLALFFVVFVTGVAGTFLYARDAHAAVNSTINFQARVLRASGAVIPDGTVSVQFKLYNVATGGTASWTETQSVSAKNGYITASLGSVTSFPTTIDWSQEQWLTMNVNGDGEMGPTRMKVTAVPYSFRSGQADTLTNGASTLNASQLAQLAPGSIQGVNSASTAISINQTGAGNLLQLQGNGTDSFTVSKAGDVRAAAGLTVGNSTSTTAGTIRWTGSVFEGYNGSAWTSLGGSALGNPIINKVKLVNETQNSAVNATATLQNDDELFFAIGANETWTYRFLIYGNANATPDFKFAVTAPAGATCKVGYSDPEGATSISNLGCGVSTGLVPGNTADDFYEVVGTVTNGATAGTVQLQWAQNTANAANSIIYAGSSVLATRAVGANGTAQAFIQNGNSFGAAAFLGTNDSNNLNFITNGSTRLTVLANGNVGIGDTNPAALFTVGSGGALRVNNTGDLSTTGTLTVNGQSTFNNNIVAGGVATGTTGTTAAPARTNVTAVTLTAAGTFANNDVIFINNAGQDYYTRIVSGAGTVNLTVSPAVSYDAGATVTKYTVQNIGATSTDYTTQANRFFQGYFLGGVVVGAGSTTISDGLISRTTGDIQLTPGTGGNVVVNGTINATTITGNGSGLTNIDGSQITNASIADTSLSANVTVQGNTFNGVNQLVKLDGTGALPVLNGAALTTLNGSNITTGTVADARLSTNVTLAGNTFNGVSQLVKLDATGKLPALDGSNLTNINGASLTGLNASNISTGTVADARLSANVTLAGNTFNGNNGLVQLTGTGALPALNGAALTALNGSNITTGTVADARLSTNVTLLGNTFNGNNQLVQLSGTGALPALNAAALTSINGTNISSGTVADARLSTNVTLKGNTFNGISQLVLLDGTGALPALNGAAITSINGSNIASGTVADARLSTNVTLSGNTFNGVNQLVKLDGTGALTALNGAALTTLNGTNISSGTVADARLSTNVTLKGNTFNGASQLVLLDGTGALPALNGGALTTLNGTNVSSGTIADARLSTNVALLTGAQSFTGLKTFAANIVLGTDTATPTAGALTLNDGTAANGFTSVLGTSTLTASRAISLPDEAGTVCLRNSTLCGFALIGAAAAQTDATTNPSLFINKTGASGNILTLQKGGTAVFSVLNSGALAIQTTATNAINVKNAGGTDYFNVDTSGGIVRIGSATSDAVATFLVLDTYNNATDPAGGVNGAMYYNGATNKSRCFQGGIWQDCITASNRNKAADQTVTNSAAFTNDTALSYAMLANGSYKIDATINYSTTSAAADFKYTVTVPAGATVYLATDADTAATTRTICNITASGQTCTLANTAGFRGIIHITGVITLGATAGNVQFQFAQNTATAGQSVTVYKGSVLQVTRTDQ